MENKRLKASELKPFDMWYCKDRRVLVYLGEDSREPSKSNIEGSHIWIWADTMMAAQTYALNSCDYSYTAFDEEYILNHFIEHLSYLIKNLNKSQLETFIVLRYKAVPNIVAYIGNFRTPLLEELARLYTGGAPKNNKCHLELKPGHLYLKQCKHYNEMYLYCGYVNLRLGTWLSKNEKKCHLYMFCGLAREAYKKDLENTLKMELQMSIKMGYSGNFGVNFRKSDLKYIGSGCTINVPKDAIWCLGNTTGAIYLKGAPVSLGKII